MANNTQKQFCMKVYRAAKALYEANPHDTVSPVFTTAQAMLESGWGEHAIGNNIFGMTVGSSWKGKKQLVTTTEIFSRANKTFNPPEKVIKIVRLSTGRYRYTVRRLFRDYSTLEEALADHDALFRKPIYADAWPFRLLPKEFAQRISDAMGALTP